MRLLREDEKKLIQCLLKEVDFKAIDLDKIGVTPYDDGGMGSLWFESITPFENRRMAKVLINKEFHDEDGMPILVGLIADEQGELYELDIWKADFSPVIKYPFC